MKILVGTAGRFPAFKLPAERIEALRASFPRHEFVHATSGAEIVAGIAGAEVVLATHLPAAAVEAAGALRWIHSWAAGVNALLIPAVVARPIVVTSSRGVNAVTVAEHALALLLALFRRLPEAQRAQAAQEWAQEPIAGAGLRLVAGAHVVVVGLGAIGALTARHLAALGARVTGVRQDPSRGAPPGVDRVVAAAQLDTVLADADAVILAAPGTGATRRLLDAGRLARLPARAVVVNVSRGGLVDEAALLAALEAGRLAGAALDVFESEPLAAGSRLWTHPAVLVTPHVAGFLPGYWQAVADLFADNLRRYEQGRPLRNVVDKAAGY